MVPYIYILMRIHTIELKNTLNRLKQMTLVHFIFINYNFSKEYS